MSSACDHNLALHNLALLRIELEEIEPLIWRRVAVPISMNLKSLHNVIQVAMGWLGCHLWEFECQHGGYGPRIPDHLDSSERVTDAATETLSSLLTSGVTEMAYVYDMSDYWRHRVTVEKLTNAVPGANYPQFLGGERRCPPEDCGDVTGYCEFLRNIGCIQRKKREAALDWYGGIYNPNEIDEKRIVANLKAIGIRDHAR